MAIFRESSQVLGDLTVQDDIFLGTPDSAATIKELQAAGSSPDIHIDFIPKGTGILRVPTGYEANIGSETRAIVNKAYADAHIAGLGLNALVTAPGAGQDGMAIVWDDGNTEYTLAAVATALVSGQGITVSSPNINLGGVVTGADVDVNVTSSHSIYIRANQGTNPAGFRAQSVANNDNQAIVYGGAVEIKVKSNGITVTVNQTGAMQYAADYSANFNATRSIPDIAWTSSHLGTKPLSATAQSPGGAQDGHIMRWNNVAGEYELVAGGSAMAIGNSIGSGTPKSVLYVNASGALDQDVANFNWDYTNKYLGVGVTTPSAFVHIGAGTATKPAFKMTSGAQLTTITGGVQDGAWEYNGTHVYFIIGSTRYQIDQQSGGGGGHVIENSGTPLTARANLNFTNGLTASDNTPDTDVKWGGVLTDAVTQVDINEKILQFIGSGATEFIVNTEGEITLTGATSIEINSATSVNLYADTNIGIDGGSVVNIGAGDAVTINIGGPLTTQAVVTGTLATFEGLQYGDNYSADFVARSLIDKGYADATYAPISGGAYWSLASGGTLTDNNTITMGANTITFTGNRVSFTPDATNAGINVGNSGGANPSTLVAGDLWYASGTNLLWTRKGGSTHYMVLSQTGGANARIPYFTDADNITGLSGFTFDAATSGSLATPRGITINQNARTVSWGNALAVNIGAHTNLTAEQIDFRVATATQAWNAGSGTIATQKGTVFEGKNITQTAGTGVTFTDVYTVFVEASVATGTGGATPTFTRNWAAGFNGSVQLSGASSLYVGTTGNSIVQIFGTGGALFSQGWQYYSNNTAMIMYTPMGATSSVLDIGTATAWAQSGLDWRFVALRSGVTTSEVASRTFRSLAIIPTHNISAGTHLLFGIDYNPSVTSLAGVASHYAFRSTSGGVLLAGGLTTADAGATITANTKLDVRGIGTGTDLVFRAADSANSVIFRIQSDKTVVRTATATISETWNTGGLSVVKGTTEQWGMSLSSYSGASYSGYYQLNTLSGMGMGLIYLASLTGTTAGTSRIVSIDMSLNPASAASGKYVGLSIGEHVGSFLNQNNVSALSYLRLGNRTANGELNASSGAGVFRAVDIEQTYNITGGTWTLVGIDYNPTTTSMTGATHYAFRSTSGGFYAQHNGLNATQANLSGIWLANNTLAANNAQQWSPSIVLEGQGWKTNATAGSQSAQFKMIVMPLQSTVTPIPSLAFQQWANGSDLGLAIYMYAGGMNFVNNSSGTGGIGFGNGSSPSARGSASIYHSGSNMIFTNNTNSIGVIDFQSATAAPSSGTWVGYKFTPSTTPAGTAIVQQVSIQGSFAPSASTITGTTLNLIPVVSPTGGTNHVFYGIDYNPSGTFSNVATHLAIRTTSGQIFFANASGDTVTASTRIDVRGLSSGTYIARFATSANVARFTVSDSEAFVTGGLKQSSLAPDDMLFNGNWTTTANNQQRLKFEGTYTQRATQFDTFIYNNIFPTLNPGANDQNFLLYSHSGTYALGAFTGTYVIGWDYNMTVTGTPAQHMAIRVRSGSVLFGDQAFMTAGDILLELNHASKALVITRFAGDVATPVDGMIHYNTTSNTFRFRQNGAWTGLGGGGGITNGAANNELMKSDGTNAVASGLSSTTLGDLILGRAGITTGGFRSITVAGNTSNISLDINSAGTGYLQLNSGGGILLNSSTQLASGAAADSILSGLNISGSATQAGKMYLRGGHTFVSGVPGGDVLIVSGKAEAAATNANSGSLYLDIATKIGTGILGNIGIFTQSVANWQGMEKGMFFGDATTAPTGNPSNGLFKWVDSAVKKMKVRDEDGEVYNETPRDGTISVTFDASAAAGEYIHVRIPYAGKFVSWDITVSDGVAGSIVVDVRKGTYASTFPLGSGASIAGTEKPTLSSQAKNQDTALSTWTTAFAEDDYIAFYIDSISGISGKIHVTLKVLKNS